MIAVRHLASEVATDTSTNYVGASDPDASDPSNPTTYLLERRQPIRRHMAVEPHVMPIVGALIQIADLELLPKGWDGEGGLPASRKAIAGALAVLGSHRASLISPSVTPRPDGGVHLEWQRPEVEVDVEPDGIVTVLSPIGDDDWDDYEFADPYAVELHRILRQVER